MSQPCRKLSTARYTGLKSSVMLPLRVSTMLRWSTDMMAAGHSTDRNTIAVLGGMVRGRNAASIQSRKPVRIESASVTSAPYTGASSEVSGGTVSVGCRQLAAIEIADQRRDRAGRIDAGAVTDALPHHPLAGRVGVDDGGRRLGDPFDAHDRVVLHTREQDVDLEILGRRRRRTGGPVHAFDQVERGDGAELGI